MRAFAERRRASSREEVPRVHAEVCGIVASGIHREFRSRKLAQSPGERAIEIRCERFYCDHCSYPHLREQPRHVGARQGAGPPQWIWQKKLAAGCEAKAKEMNWKMNISVVDSGANQIFFEKNGWRRIRAAAI